MKRILVPVDFSPTAEKAFRFALEIAGRSKGTVVLYHLYTSVASGLLYTAKTKKLYNDQQESNLLKRLSRLKKKVTAGSDAVSVSTIVGRTPIVNNILGFAEANHIDMIVMGTQGASGFKKAVIGSVASRIIKKSDIPVLVVPEKFEWKIPEQIVFASDCQPTDIQTLPVILSFAKAFKRGVNIIHVFSSNATETGKQVTKELFHTYSFSFQRLFSDHRVKFQLMEAGSVMEAMENLEKKLPYDVLAMVRGKKSFFENYLLKSFTQEMAYISRKPLLIIPEDINVKLRTEETILKAHPQKLDIKIRKIKHKVIN